MNTATVKSKPMWRGLVLRLSFLAAIFTAIYKMMDNVTVHNFITAPDGLTAAFAYLIIGGWTGLISSLLFAVLFGRKLVDSDFERLELNPSKICNIQAILAGLISAGSTLFFLWGNQFGDPSVLIALGNAVILYTMLYDLFKKQVTLAQIIRPALLVCFGSMMAAYSGSIEVTLIGIFFVLVVSNGLAAFSEVIEQAGCRASDGVNFFVWRFFWLALTGTVLAFTVSEVRGQLPTLLQTLEKGVVYIPWIILTMFFVFLGIGMKLVAKKHDAVSIVLIVYSVQLIMGYPLTIFGNLFFPGVFGQLPSDFWIWVVRVVGATLMIWGVIYLQKNSSQISA